MKNLAALVVAATLLIGCRKPQQASFTIIEHTSAENDGDGYERFVIRYDDPGKSLTTIKTRCGFTKYKDGSVNQRFCPGERLPTVGTPIYQCTSLTQAEPCVYRAAGGYLAIREGALRDNDEMNLFIESEKATK